MSEISAALRRIKVTESRIMEMREQAHTIGKYLSEKSEQFNKKLAQEPPNGNC